MISKEVLKIEEGEDDNLTFKPIRRNSAELLKVGELLCHLDGYELEFVKAYCDLYIAKNCL